MVRTSNVRTAFAAGFVFVAAASCRLLFGVDDLSGGALAPSPGTEAGPDAIAEAGADAPPDCDPQSAGYQFCACTKHDFCDDFDIGEPRGAHWVGLGGVSNPFANPNAGTVDIAVDLDGGFTGPGALTTSVSETHTSGWAFLAQSADAGPARRVDGLLYGAEVEVQSVGFIEQQRGPLDGGSAVIAAIGKVDQVQLKIAGVALLAGTDGMYLFASRDLLGGKRDPVATPDDVMLQFEGGNVQGLGGWLRFELLIGSRTVAVAQGYECADVPDGPVVAGSFATKIGPLCHAAPAGMSDLQTGYGMVTGAAVYGGGSVVVKHDSVTLDILPAP